MSDECQACRHPSEGYAHTCAGSGTWKAAEGYVAGQVDAIEEGWPRFRVVTSFTVRAPDEALVKDKLTGYVSALLSDDEVEAAEFTVTELAEVSA